MTKQTEDDMENKTSWPIIGMRYKGELYWQDPSQGNRYNCGNGWIVVLPWGERRRYLGLYAGDNRVSIEDADDVFILGWTRPLREYIAECGYPVSVEA